MVQKSIKVAFPGRERVRASALRVLDGVKPVQQAEGFGWFGSRTNGGRKLPEQYLVHFLFIELLEFPHDGADEKVAWTVPVEYDGVLLAISHRKMGLGIFAEDPVGQNEVARKLATRIHKAVKEGRPFFDWLAQQAVAESKVNVVNRAHDLFRRFDFLRTLYRQKIKEAEARKDETAVNEIGPGHTQISIPWFQLRDEAKWLAISAIEAFFSWTEHVFIHLAILRGQVRDALEVSSLAEADWPDKFKAALGLAHQTSKRYFDQLVDIRREIRNFHAHGAFGKDGEAFHFHSTAGAVPVLLPHKVGSRKFMVGGEGEFDESSAFAVLDDFIQHLWSGDRKPAFLYTQEAGLDLLLTWAADGTYVRAMSSIEEMKSLIDEHCHMIDQSANMDW